MKYQVIYASKTGNTQQVADEIYDALPGEDKQIISVEEFDPQREADVYFVGFWTDRGSCSMEVADVLEQLNGKKLALFGTCGMGDDPEYYKTIQHQMDAWTPDTYTDLGFFLCQGRMQQGVKDKYEAMEGKMPEEQRQRMLRQWETGQNHPDETDFAHVRGFVEQVLGKLHA